MTEKPYRLKYVLKKPEVGHFGVEDLEKGDGATDALFLCSLLYPPDGGFSLKYWSFDGRNEGKPLEDKEVFKVWLLMAANLAKSKTLDEKRRAFAREVFDTFMRMVS